MRSYELTKIMPYDAKLVRDVILDVEKYPLFLPYCKNAQILKKNGDYFLAKMQVTYKNYSGSYISRVFSGEENDEYIIKVDAVSGPFRHLNNIWTIKSVNNEAKVHFSIDFQFKSGILDKVIGLMFSRIAKKITNAFESRAGEIHARRS